MAAYRFSAKVIGRSAGRTACGAAAYRSASEITCEKTGETHDYTRKGGVVHSEIMLPDNAPDWMGDREQLWNAVEAVEKRKDAQLAREVQMNLPHELDEEQRRELAREFVREQFVERGMVADLAIHTPDEKGDNRNHHIHVMLTTRELKGEGFASKKQRDWNKKDLLEDWREEWANYQNRALERAGHDVRVDHRSYEEQGIDREPQPKLGPIATQMERQGRRSHAGDDLRAVRARNEERARLAEDSKFIEMEIARERRRLAQAFEKAHAQEIVEAPKEPEQSPPVQQDPQEQQRAEREAALREQVQQMESAFEGRGRMAVLWEKLRGRMAWSAERDLATARQELTDFQSQTKPQSPQDARREAAREQSSSDRGDPDKTPQRSLNRDPERQRQQPERNEASQTFSEAALEEQRREQEKADRMQRRYDFYRERFREQREQSRDRGGPEMEM